MGNNNKFAAVTAGQNTNTNANNNAAPKDDASTATARATRDNTRELRTAQPYRSVSIGVTQRMMSRQAINAVVSTAVENFVTLPVIKAGQLANAYNEGTIRFLPLDAEQENAPISAVLFCHKIGNEIAVVNLGLASTVTDDLGDIYIENNENRNRRDIISVPRTPGDIYNDVDYYANVISQIVSREYPQCNVNLVGQMILQEGFDLTDQMKMHNVLFRCIDITEGYYIDLGVIDARGTGLDLSEFAREDGELCARITMGGDDGVDDLGNLHREDITVSLTSRFRESRYGQNTMQTRPIVGARGYMDACLVGVNDDVRDSSTFAEGETAVYMPTFVITGLDTYRGGVTLSHLMACILSSNILVDKNRWIAAFRPEYAINHPTRFVGALGKDVPVPGSSYRNPEFFGNLTPSELQNYAGFCKDAFVLDDMGVAIDVETAGQISPNLEIILDASYGNEDAILALVAATDEALSGTFAQAWEDAGKPKLVYTDDTLIPMGDFNDEGKRRALANLDLIYLQHLDVSQDTIYDFTDALYDGEIDSLERASNLVKIIKSVAPTAVIRGWATRVFFTNDFFELCSEALSRSGVRIRPDNNYTSEDTSRSRGVRQQRHRGTRGMSGMFDSYRSRGTRQQRSNMRSRRR